MKSIYIHLRSTGAILRSLLVILILSYSAACDSYEPEDESAETSAPGDVQMMADSLAGDSLSLQSFDPEAAFIISPGTHGLIGYVAVEDPTRSFVIHRSQAQRPETEFNKKSKAYNAAGGDLSNEIFVEHHPTNKGSHTILFKLVGAFSLGNLHVQATSLDGPRTSCAALNVGKEGNDVRVPVRCMRDGVLADVPFVLQVFDQKADAAFLSVESRGGVSNIHNPWGTNPIVTLVGVGHYRGSFAVRSPSPVTRSRTIAVVSPKTPIGSCSVFAWNPNDNGQFTFDVRCFDRNGDPRFISFDLLFMRDTPKVGFAWANLPTAQKYIPHSAHRFNASGQTVEIIRPVKGFYSIRFAGLAPSFSGQGTIKVSAHGSEGNTCDVDSWSKGPTDVTATVLCWNPKAPATSRFVDSRFTIIALSK